MKTIFITGGSTGIGAATAKKFNENNWRVIISSRNNETLHKTKKSIIENSTSKSIDEVTNNRPGPPGPGGGPPRR